MPRPDVWMISISDNPVSQYYRDICKPTWEEQGFDVIDFEAVTPETVEKENMNELLFHNKIHKSGEETPFTPTEIAIWWSHFVLWHKCLIRKKPIIVAEHDAFVLKDLPNDLYRPSKLKFAFLGRVGRTLAPCTAYYLTPEFAFQLIQVRGRRWRDNRAGSNNESIGIYMNVDGYMLMEYLDQKRQKKMRVADYSKYVTQMHDDDMGTTIEH